MNIAAFGGIVLTIIAAVYALCWVCWQAGKRDGRAELYAEMAERRAERRAEVRAPKGRHHLAPFPAADELFERLPSDTGELRVLAETGDIEGIRRLNTAFFRTLSLREWTRKRDAHQYANTGPVDFSVVDDWLYERGGQGPRHT